MKPRSFKRFICLISATAMLLTDIPVNAAVAETATPASEITTEMLTETPAAASTGVSETNISESVEIAETQTEIQTEKPTENQTEKVTEQPTQEVVNQTENTQTENFTEKQTEAIQTETITENQMTEPPSEALAIIAENIEIEIGDKTFDLLSTGIQYDKLLYSISIENDGGFDINKPGEYFIKYIAHGLDASYPDLTAERVVTVKEKAPEETEQSEASGGKGLLEVQDDGMYTKRSRTRALQSIIVKNGGNASSSGLQQHMKYIANDPSDPDCPENQWRMVYCLDDTFPAPDSSISWDGQGRMKKEIVYCTVYGVRYWGQECQWPNYRTGLGWQADYIATSYAIHIFNGEYTLEEIQAKTSGGMYTAITRMVTAARNAANYSEFNGAEPREFKPAGLSYSISPTSQDTWTETTVNGVAGYRTSVNYVPQTGEARNLNNVSIAFNGDSHGAQIIKDENTSLNVGSDSNAASFYLFIPTDTYKNLQKTGATINVDVSGQQAVYYSNWVYDPADPAFQRVTFLEASYGTAKTLQSVSATVTQENSQGSVTINKTDAETGTILQGVTFKVYEWDKNTGSWKDYCNAPYFSITENYRSEKLLEESVENEGKFKIVEVGSQAGYVNSGWSQEFNVAAGNANFTYDVTNTVYKGNVAVKKTDAETGGVLNGASFALYEWNTGSNSFNKLGNLAYNAGAYNYQYNGFKWKESNQGRFKVVEESSQPGYVNAGWSQEFTLNTSNNVAIQDFSYNVTNNIYKGNVSVGKTDSETGAVLTDATFTLYEWNGSSYVKVGDLAYDSGSKTYKLNGFKWKSSNQGKFKVAETKAPTGYVLSNWSQEFTLNTANNVATQNFTYNVTNTVYKGNVSIKKTDSETAEILSGATFTLYEWNGSSYVKLSDLAYDAGSKTYKANGFRWKPSNQGKFKVAETKAAPGYVLNNWSQEFTLNTTNNVATQNFTYNVTNTVYKGNVSIKKTDSETAEILSGATFTLYEWNGSTYVKLNDLAYDAGSKTYKLNGFRWKPSNQGKFKVAETKAPEGYWFSGWSQEFTLNTTNNVATQSFTYNVTNIVYKGNVVIKKTDSENGKNLEGAVFTLYEWNGSTYVKLGDLAYDAGTKTYKKEGFRWKPSNKGKFKVVETDSPYGYVNSGWSQEFSLNLSSKDATQTFTYDVTNVRQKGIIKLQKQDAETGASQGSATLEGAEYYVFTQDGYTDGADKDSPAYQTSIKTDADGKAQTGELELGKYYVVEHSPSPGYLLNPTVYSVELKPTNKTERVFYSDCNVTEDVIRGDVLIYKFGESQDPEEEVKTPLEGVEFTITSKTTGEKVVITTNKAGMATTMGMHDRGALPYDTYTISETKTPDGFKIMEPFDFDLTEEGFTYSYIIENKHVLGALQVVKKDKTTGKIIPVAGAEFKILDKDGNVVKMKTYYPEVVEHESFTTDENGQFVLPDKLVIGDYTLIEINSPAGYLLNDTEIPFSVTGASTYEKPLVVVCEDMPAMGKISIEKLDSQSGDPIEGVEFSITPKEDIITPDGTVRATAGVRVDTITTDGEGKAVSKALYLGTYIVQEIAPKEEYLPNPKEYEVELKYKDQLTDIVEAAIEVENERMVPLISVAKLADKTTGAVLQGSRYEGEKKPGIYYPDEEIDYLITISNNGNVTVKNLVVEDTPSEELLQYLVKDSGHFEVAVGDVLTSEQGKDINILSAEQTKFTLDQLEPGDRVTVHFKATVIKEVDQKVDLNNLAVVTGEYDNGKEDKPVPPDEDDEDEDKINLGYAKISISKLADKTTGVELQGGRYEGEKKPGLYFHDEEVDYTVIISNTGTVAVKNLVVEDTPSAELLQYLVKDSGHFEVSSDEILTSEQGNEVKVLKAARTKFTLDLLEPGDRVTVHFKATVINQVDKKVDLDNLVTVSGEFNNGKEDKPVPPDEDDKDNDKINLGYAKISISKLANKTTGAELKGGRYEGEKKPGIYFPDEEIDYIIIISNTGMVDIKNLVVEDTVSKELYQYLIKDSEHFEVNVGDTLTSENGKPVKVLDASRTKFTLDQLEIGDRVAVHFKAKVIHDVRDEVDLDNIVTVTGEYSNGKEDRPVPPDEDDKDNDKINLGYAELSISKLADKTTGAELQDGRYKGTKKPGIYFADEEIDYTIIVSNTGVVSIKDIVVEDTMSEDLLQYIVKDSGHFEVSEGDKLQSDQKQEVTILKVTPASVTLSGLDPGDRVTLHFKATLIDSVDEKVDLENLVTVTGKYEDGDEDKPVPPDEDDHDEDKVDLDYAKVSISKLADRTTGTKLANGRYEGEKRPGLYFPDEEVNYTIIVSNTGTVAVKNLVVEDTPSEELLQYLVKDSEHFEITEGEILTSDRGKPVNVLEASRNKFTIDYLEPGDRVTVQFKAKLVGKDQIDRKVGLDNLVTVTGEFNTGKEDKPIPKDDDDEDNDKIYVGYILLSISKLANKTTGAELQDDGRYNGTKKPGVYYAGEEIDYTIIVSNPGLVPIKDIVVEDTMSDELLQYLVEDSIHFEASEGAILKSEKGQDINVLEIAPTSVKLSGLEPGDRLILHLKATLKNELDKKVNLRNLVTVTGMYEDGGKEKPVPPDKDDWDMDKVDLAYAMVSVAKAADKTTGINLVNGRYEGEKKPGYYEKGDTAVWTIIVKNQGTIQLREIVVEDTVSKKLVSCIESGKFNIPSTMTMKTADKKEVHITKLADNKISIDKLEIGDSLALEFITPIKKDADILDTKLNNYVEVTAKYGEDKVVEKDEDDSDQDDILIKSVGSITAHANGQGSIRSGTVKTGDNTNIFIYIGLAGLMLALILLLIIYRHKKSEGSEEE